MEVFKELHHSGDPVPHGDHYDDFESVYGTDTAEEHRPSLKKAPKVKGHGMPINPTTQTAKNANLVLQCEDCLKWQVVESKPVIKEIESLMYTCGSVFQNIDGHENTCLRGVFVRQN